MQELSMLISTLGFPVVACVGLGLYISSRDKAIREDNKVDKERLYEEIKFNRVIISELTRDIKTDIVDIKTMINLNKEQGGI